MTRTTTILVELELTVEYTPARRPTLEDDGGDPVWTVTHVDGDSLRDDGRELIEAVCCGDIIEAIEAEGRE